MGDIAVMKRDGVGRPQLAAADIHALSQLLAETPELGGRRLDARERYQKTPLPDRVRHLWRFTNPEHLMPVASALPLAAPAAADLPETPEDGAAALLQGGTRSRAVLSDSARAAGLEILPLAEAGEAAVAALGSTAAAGFFSAFNDAAWNTGLFVRVPRGVTLPGPVHVRIDAGAGTTVPRLLVLVEDGAEAVVVEDHVGGRDARVVGVSEALVGADARLSRVLLQRWAADVNGHLSAASRLERGAELLTVFASFGGSRAKMELAATLAGEGARSRMVGVALAGGGQHLDHHTRHEHLVGRTWSQIDFKAVVSGRSRSSYTGLIRIAADAPESEAYQENRNLMLSDTGRVDTIPELEILTDEVSCSHGATVAPVDMEQVFYLQSRGLDRKAAMGLVVRGFVEDTLRRLPDAPRAAVAALVADRIDALNGGRS